MKLLSAELQRKAVSEAIAFISSYYQIPPSNAQVLRSYLNVLYSQACIDQMKIDRERMEYILERKP